MRKFHPSRARTKGAIVREWQEIVVRAIERGVSLAPLSRLPKSIRLLGESQKVNKGIKKGVYTAIVYLAPSTSAGSLNLCPDATIECSSACLAHHSGKMALTDSQNARLWKTTLFIGAPKLFRELLDAEIQTHILSAYRRDMVPAIRFDGSSDTGWGRRLARAWKACMFYDYTKSYKRAIQALKRPLPNYSLTFSYSGRNLFETLSILKQGGNVSVVFAVRKDGELPSEWLNFKVIDGDETDVRFMDELNVIVGLRLKGNNFREQLKRGGCFVVDPSRELLLV